MITDHPFAISLEETFQNLIKSGFVFPDFTNSETINCVSDYAGDRPTDNHYVLSFLFYDYKNSNDFATPVEDLRNREPEWKDNSFIEYKKLNGDKVRRRLLPEFLEAANKLRGILIVFYIDKTIDSLFDAGRFW